MREEKQEINGKEHEKGRKLCNNYTNSPRQVWACVLRETTPSQPLMSWGMFSEVGGGGGGGMVGVAQVSSLGDDLG